MGEGLVGTTVELLHAVAARTNDGRVRSNRDISLPRMADTSGVLPLRFTHHELGVKDGPFQHRAKTCSAGAATNVWLNPRVFEVRSIPKRSISICGVITTETLRRFAPRAVEPDRHAEALESARRTSSVNDARRLCHFMGQVFVETAGLTLLEENLNYRNPARLDMVFSAVRGIADAADLIARGPEAIANRVYAGRLGNGDEASGDGWRYRGSGYKQLTGRTNYRDIGAILGMDLEGHPELAREPAAAARIAFAYWDACRCSPLADAGDVEAITEKVNGPAKLGLAERRDAVLRAVTIWG
jgi:putative chitinase